MRHRLGRDASAARVRRIGPVAVVTALLLGLQLSLAGAARADGGDFSIDYAAAAPDTYDHSTGLGGEYADGGTDHAVESLEAGDFTCGDVVEFFDAVTVDAGATGTQAITITNSFANDSTGQSGVGFGDVVYVQLNPGDSGNIVSGNETVVLADQTTSDGNTVATIDVGGLEAGEQVIVAIGVQLVCPDPENATGNVQTALESAETSEGDAINTGNQTVPLMHVSQVAPPAPVPAIAVTKE
ncbi:MAG TPA: hypothetical protein VKA30_12485, partial [Actinomycetota bacterium]|nr:hypothetical protein [Actinomycetota bacterium]